MELTKKDIRQIDSDTTDDAWHIGAKASAYAHLYEIAYFKKLIEKLQIRVQAIEEVYQRQKKTDGHVE